VREIQDEHPGRLAVEPLYGYMVRNACPFGVLSTYKGWCFLQRYDGRTLRMTPMHGDFFAQAGVSNGAAAAVLRTNAMLNNEHTR
jgi:hypothetical protein